MSMTTTPRLTTIKVPVGVRDELSRRAKAAGMTQSTFLETALDHLDMVEFQRAMADWEPDEEYLAEMREWDQADLASPRQPAAITA